MRAWLTPQTHTRTHHPHSEKDSHSAAMMIKASFLRAALLAAAAGAAAANYNQYTPQAGP